MESETILKEILHALELHATEMKGRFEGIEQRMEKMEHRLDGLDQRMGKVEHRLDGLDQRMEKMDKYLNRLETKNDVARMDVLDTQKTSNFLLNKITQHEERLLTLTQQA